MPKPPWQPSTGYGVGVYRRDPEPLSLGIPLPAMPRRRLVVVWAVVIALALVFAAILCFCSPVQPASTSAAACPVTRVAP